jgi:hypothetical protein
MAKLTLTELKERIEQKPLNTIVKSQDEDLKEKIFCNYIPENLEEMPENFSGKEVWKGIITPVNNQGSCGSCWAFATVGTLSDRFNIQSQGKMNINLSPTTLLLCTSNFQDMSNISKIKEQITITDKSFSSKIYEDVISNIQTSACYGNTIYNSCLYLYLYGAFTEECVPYDKNLGIEKEFQKISDFTSSMKLPFCTYVTGPLLDMCSDYFISDRTGEEGGIPAKAYRIYDIYNVPGTEKNGGSEKFIRNEIYKWGPVVSAMKIYEDFYTFDAKNEIYEWNGQGKQIGGHAVEITGWGVENGKPYWEIANTWGKDWGIDGYFKMIRGKNNCEIEDNVFGLVPDFFYKYGTKLDVFPSCIPSGIKDLRYIYDNNINAIGGGVDPETGYSRRAMNVFNNFDFTNKIKISPESFNNFVAGRILTPNKNNDIIDNKVVTNKHFSIFLFIIIIVLITVIIIILSKF